MADKGPNVPHRTPRKRALEFSSADKFNGGNDMGGKYNTQAGYPDGMNGFPPADMYKEQAPSVADAGESKGEVPFALKGGK